MEDSNLLSKYQQAFYRFLKTKELENEEFLIKDICDATGWKESTVETYLSKGYLKDILSKNLSGRLVSHGVLNLNEKEFHRKISQSQTIKGLGYSFLCQSTLNNDILIYLGKQ